MSTYISYPASGSSGLSTTLGALDANTPTAAGATVAAGVLSMQSASALYPGLVNTTTQTFAGAKTFSSDAVFSSQVGIDVTPSHTLHIQLPADNNVLIDGRTNPRNLTQGAFRIEHTPSITGTRPINVDVNAAGIGDTHGIVVDYITGALGPLSTCEIFEADIDASSATGGVINVFTADLISAGSITAVNALRANPGVSPISQTTGAYVASNQSWDYDSTGGGAYTDVTSGTHQLFTHNGDMLYVGKTAATFADVAILLSIGASSNILPTFQYWNGAAWTAFTPVDGTNGFQHSGNIIFGTLTGWASTTVNAVAAYYIRVTRTKASLPTKPTETSITLTSGANYGWDSTGAITAGAVSAPQFTSTVATGTAPFVVASTTTVSNLQAATVANRGVANGVASLDSSGLVPIAQLPPAAIERLVIVADQTARYALTTATVQNGDTVQQTDTNVMYFVKDDTNLNNSNGYALYTAGSATVASTVPTTATSSNATYYPAFFPSSADSNQALYLDTTFTYNPSTDTLTATNFAGTATNANNIATTTKSDNVTYYPTFVAANSSSTQVLDVGPMTYNPSTSTLTATTFSGALSGNATTATNGFQYLSTSLSVYGGTNSTLAFTGAQNTVVGVGAGNSLTTHANNTLFGYFAGRNSTAQKLTALGRSAAGNGITTGTDNTFVGFGAGLNVTSGARTVALGCSAIGSGVTTGADNIAIGSVAGSVLAGGAQNVLIGSNSGSVLTTQGDNTFLGFNAGASATTSSSVIIGSQAAGNATFSGTENTVIGYKAGYNATTATRSVLIGSWVNSATGTSMTGADNTMIGANVGTNIVSGARATIVGSQAVTTGAMTGTSNVLVGYGSGTNITSAAYLTAVGTSAAGSGVMTGANNVLMGYQAGNALTSGHDNTFIGYQAGLTDTTRINATALGSGALNTADNEMMFGNSSVTTNVFHGDVSATTFTGATGFTYAAKTANYTAVINDYVNCTTGTFTVTLPTAVGVAGRSIKIKNTGTGVITIATTSSQTIDGLASTTIKMGTAGDYMEVSSDGANWKIDVFKVFVGAKYQCNSQSLNTGTRTIINFATSVVDPGSVVTTGASWKFTAGIPGLYMVSATCQLEYSATSIVTGAFELFVHLNNSGTATQMLGGRNMDATNNSMSDASGSTIISLASGDYIDIRASQNTGATRSLTADLTLNNVSIYRIN